MLQLRALDNIHIIRTYWPSGLSTLYHTRGETEATYSYWRCSIHVYVLIRHLVIMHPRGYVCSTAVVPERSRAGGLGIATARVVVYQRYVPGTRHTVLRCSYSQTHGFEMLHRTRTWVRVPGTGV